jgi:hypothetical protein
MDRGLRDLQIQKDREEDDAINDVAPLGTTE